jgi:hypothetical protein
VYWVASHDEIALAYNASTLMMIALDNTAFPEFAGGVAMLLPVQKP